MPGFTAEEIKTIDSLTDQRAGVFMLPSHAGWKLFIEEMEKTSAYAYSEMVRTSNPHDAAKQMGAWHVAQSAIHFPRVKLATIEQQMRLLTKKE